MARLVLALVSATAAFEDVALAGLDESLSLLQLSSRRSGELEHNGINPPWEPGYGISPKPGFGPDGTWATPYCKDIRGCETAYCPDGCNGGAYWEAYPYDNDRLGTGEFKGMHFLSCYDGMAAGAAVLRGSGILRCLNSENSTNPAYWPPVDAAIETAVRPQVGARVGLEAYGKEFCPAECVDDCAAFKFGNFLYCGNTGGRTHAIYDGQAQRGGPNRQCDQDKVIWIGAMMTTTWCGQPTTTTPPPAPEPDDDDAGDGAEAVGDPHLRTNTGSRVDLQ